MAEESKFTLDKIQQWMQGALLDPYHTNEKDIGDLICPSNRMDAHQHLAIYQRSYVARLRECMSKQFGTLAYALGANLFQQFTDQYLQTYPSQSYTLHDLGEKFPRYLEETRPDRDLEEKEDWPDFLIELASFEYHIQIIFDAEDSTKYSPANINTPDENLKLVPLLHLIEFRFPVNQYFQSYKKGERPELPFEQASWCVIYRNGFQVAIHGISYWQYRFLKEFHKSGDVGGSIGKIALESGRSQDEVYSYWGEWKELWVGKGLICLGMED
jgi:hypothetical protein